MSKFPEMSQLRKGRAVCLTVTLLTGSLLASACSGQPPEGDQSSAGELPGAGAGGASTPPVVPNDTVPPATMDPALVTGELGRGPTSVSRLSHSEYVATVVALLGVHPEADIDLLPPDSFSPFDNAYGLQLPSKALIEGLKAVAERLVARLLADPTLTSTVVGCAPASPSDETCFRQFVTTFGRRVLRRPLSEAEVDEYLPFLAFSTQSGDFNTAVGMVIRALLQDMEFVYRFELGVELPDAVPLIRLTDFELAARLAFLLWGQTPDDELLDASEVGALQTAEGLRLAAERLLSAPPGVQRLQRFHALWLGYEVLPHDAMINSAMRQETDALVARVVFDEQRSWLDLLTMPETFVGEVLAAQYGLTATGAQATWVPYGASGRAGMLSHGALLANGVKAGDTSPTLRGKFILDRLLCQPVPPPPEDLAVNADEPPPDVGGQNCKVDRYAAHATGVCAGCHTTMDGLGFGLENYDAMGRYRAFDDGRADCPIAGTGTVAALGSFSGPAELGTLLAGSDRVPACLVQHLYQFALGRQPRAEDQATLTSLVSNLQGHSYGLRQLLLDWVAHESFRYRVVDTVGP